MQEAKQTFPGNRIGGYLMDLSKYLFGAIFLISVLEWETPPNTSLAVHFLGSKLHTFLFLALLMVGTLSYQHKAVFMKKANEDKVQFWNKSLPYFIYARREINVEDLSYYEKKENRNIVNDRRSGAEQFGGKTIFTTLVYDGKKKIFVFDGK